MFQQAVSAYPLMIFQCRIRYSAEELIILSTQLLHIGHHVSDTSKEARKPTKYRCEKRVAYKRQKIQQ